MDGFFQLLSFGDGGWADDLLHGAVVTLQISAGGFVVGLLIGGLAAWVKLRGSPWAVAAAHAYTSICRSVPEILLIIILFSMRGRVFFDLDQHDVRPDQEPTVRAWAEWLRAHPGASFMVEGHCDERGTREYNLGLGARRATSIKNLLVSLGVEAGRVRTISYGKERPAEAGGDEGAWAKNRRGVAVPSGSGA